MIGLIGKKIGMTQIFDEGGAVTPVTVIQVEPNLVVGERTPERDGYSAVVLAGGKMKSQRATRPYRGQFGDNEPRREMVELRGFEAEYGVGQELSIDLFEGTLFVDVTGTGKGKGYQGVMRRHGFSGGEMSHGSKFKREPGATGQAASPSKILKGTKMPGRMGGGRRTVQNLRVVKVDPERQVLLVRGSVPGNRGGYVLVKRAKKKNR